MRVVTKGLVAALAVFAGIGFTSNQEEPEAVVEVFAPDNGEAAGIDGIGWFIDLAVEFEGGDVAATGFTANQLTGPGVHANAAPFPGAFGPGKDEAFQGLIVLTSTTLGGSCENLAGVFNLTGPTNVAEDEVEIWDTWIVEAAYSGTHTASTLWVAVAADKNGDGIFNDAPDTVPDSNGDGKCNERDIRDFGSASNIVEKHFFIN
jgi:hypothetical protein